MLGRITQTFVLAGVILGLLIIAMQPTLAAPAQSQPKPSDFFWSEVGMGMLGGAVGGIVGAALGYTLIPLIDSSSSAGLAGGFLGGFVVGIPGGACLGVIVTGSLNGVQGPIIPTCFAAFIGEALGLAGVSWVGSVLDRWIPWVSGQPGFTTFLLGGATVGLAVAAIGATIVYNSGAKMKSDKSKPAALSWQLPLVTLRF